MKLDIKLTKTLISNGLNVENITTGLSMFPLLLPKQKIIISPIKNTIHKGDIVSFVQQNSKKTQLVLHRVIQIENTHIITRGDACLTNDEPIKNTDIIGILTKSKWIFFYINHQKKIWKFYAKILFALNPISYKFNRSLALLSYRILKLL